MKRKVVKRTVFFLTAAVFSMSMALPFSAVAAEKKAKSEVVMKMGKKVHLFHGGKVGAQTEIAVGDAITVYRASGKTRQEKEVGQVRVLSFIGEHYFEAEIIKGEIKVGDIARKDATSLLVQPAR